MTQTTIVTTKKFTLLQLFNIVDGRLSTGIEDVYDILGHVCRFPGIMTHHLPTAMRYIKEVLKPDWFYTVTGALQHVEKQVGNKEFQPMINWIKQYNAEVIFDIPQMPEEREEEFGKYMVDNSLLNRIGSK